MPEVHGRADTLFGSVVFEFKRNLQQELNDVLAQLPNYLAERERLTQRRFVGIATDGAEFIAYELRAGAMVEIGRHTPSRTQPTALLAWLEPALSNRDDLLPDPLTVERELGRSSLSFGRARGVLERLWAELSANSEVLLKRQLWDGLLREAYGTAVGDDALFLQHTYLTIVAKTIAARVLDRRLTTRRPSSRATRSTKSVFKARSKAISSIGYWRLPTAATWCCGSPDRRPGFACAMSRSMSSNLYTKA
jgi:hypothetical protein